MLNLTFLFFLDKKKETKKIKAANKKAEIFIGGQLVLLFVSQYLIEIFITIKKTKA
jgi:hypothetical protein